MRQPVELVKEGDEVIRGVGIIQRALKANVLAVVLVDHTGVVSTVPNPHMSPADVFRAIGGQDWDASARVAEEFRV